MFSKHPKERMKAPIEHDRCIVSGVKTNDKSFSALSKVFSDVRSQKE